MYTKNLLSVAAAVAVLSTGAMAFDSFSGKIIGGPLDNWEGNVTGTVGDENGSAIILTTTGTDGKTKFIRSSYSQGTVADNNISLSNSFKGDALIYPAFNDKDGWATEIVVRNTSDKAIVAKAVLYDGKDSHEVKDFNIYLSAYDVCRFKIEDGAVKSTDGSIKTYGAKPHFVDSNATTATSQDLTDYALAKFADDADYPFDSSIANNDGTGYVIIYGMEQSTGLDGSTDGFHNNHAGLYAAYARTLDVNRSTSYVAGDSDKRGWRNVKNTNVSSITNGMFVAGVDKAPYVDLNATVHWNQWFPAGSVGHVNTANHFHDHNATFSGVDDVLTGQVRIYNNELGRDMLLNAKAISGFTDTDQRALWTPGEYASIADRCIKPIDVNGTKTTSDQKTVAYDGTCITEDAIALHVSSTIYTFANATGDIRENKLLITQPYKRFFAQLASTVDTGHGYKGTANGKATYDTDREKYQSFATGLSNYFTVDVTNTYDEDEHKKAQNIGGTIITSPASTSANPDAFKNELQEVNAGDMEKNPGFEGSFDSKNGFTSFNIGSDQGVPALTTQMVGSVVGSAAQMNWVYSDTND